MSLLKPPALPLHLPPRWASNPLVFLAQLAWLFSFGFRRQVAIYLGLAAIAVALTLASPVVISALLNRFSGVTTVDATLLRETAWYLGLFFLVGVVFWMFHGPSRVIEQTLSMRIRRRIHERFFASALDRPLAWHRDTHSGKMIDRAARAASGLEEFVSASFEIVHVTVRLLVTAIAISLIVPEAGLMLLVGAGIAVYVIGRFDRFLVTLLEQWNAHLAKVASVVQDFLTNVRTVISLRIEREASKELHRTYEDLIPIRRRNALWQELKWCSTTMMVNVVVCGISFWYCWRAAYSTGTPFVVGTFYLVFEYLRNAADSFYQVTQRYGEVLRQATALRGASDLLRSTSVVEGNGVALSADWKRIEIKDLSFSYDSGQELFQSFAFDLSRGRRIALVGESGSGKSSLLALLRGLSTPQQAMTRVDDGPWQAGLGSISHVTSLIPQDPELFAQSVRTNVTMGLSCSDEELMRFLRLARFDTVADRLPAGVETNIAEKGVSLSGGEKQRLALARGLFFARHSDIILLDEPTSSVDAVNERRIYRALLEELGDKCVVSSLHRLHLLPLFDEVVVLVKGVIVERGSFRDLIRSGGVLAAMWEQYRHHDEGRVAA